MLTPLILKTILVAIVLVITGRYCALGSDNLFKLVTKNIKAKKDTREFVAAITVIFVALLALAISHDIYIL